MGKSTGDNEVVADDADPGHSQSAGSDLLPAPVLPLHPDLPESSPAPAAHDAHSVTQRPMIILGCLVVGATAVNTFDLRAANPWLIASAFGFALTVLAFAMIRIGAGEEKTDNQNDRGASEDTRDEHHTFSLWVNFVSSIGVIIAIIGLGGAWAILRDYRVDAHDIASLVDSADRLWTLDGYITTPPEITLSDRTFSSSSAAADEFSLAETLAQGGAQTIGLTGANAYRGPLTTFNLSVRNAHLNDGSSLALTGRLLVRVQGRHQELHSGDPIRITGILSRFQPQRNPGEFDRQRYAMLQHVAGAMNAAGVMPLNDAALTSTVSARWITKIERAIAHFRGSCQAQVSAWINEDVSATHDGAAGRERDALLSAFMLGQRGPAFSALNQQFKDVGLAHLVAISGMNLAILAGTLVVILKMLGAAPWLRRVMTIALILAYLFLVPAQVPVWRAGIMVLIFVLAGAGGRRIDWLNTLAWSAIVLLIWRPSEVTSAGTQLSYGVVAALMMLTYPMRAILFGPSKDEELIGRLAIAVERFKTFFAANLVAFLISLPVIAFHFNMVCPIAIVSTILAMPLATAILSCGLIKAILTALLPGASILLGPILRVTADGLIGLVHMLAALPGSSIAIGPPGLLWTILTLGVMVWFIGPRRPGSRFTTLEPEEDADALTLADLARRRLKRRLVVGGIAALFLGAWLMRFQLGFNNMLRSTNGLTAHVTGLAVGNGSCYLVDADNGDPDGVFMFDAGSDSSTIIAQTSILPALRTMGILEVPTIFLSHPDADHYSAVLDVAIAMHTQRVLMTQQFMHQVNADPNDPPARLVAALRSLGIRVRIIRAGEILAFGDAGQVRVNVLHPMADAYYKVDNEASMVLKVTINGRRILFTGDLQDQGAKDLITQTQGDDLDCDILEFPHHGSYKDETKMLLGFVTPDVVIQSTGPARLRLDRWKEYFLEHPQYRRYITDTDGAITISITNDGTISVHTFRGSD